MYKILVVDDEPKIREVIKEYAEFSGYEVTEAADGMSAVGLCKLNDYDLIIMDIMMPIMNGYEVAKTIRSMDREDAKTIPIIAMTANAFTEDRIRAKEAGMNEHIAKPVDAKSLVKVIHELVK